jgi:ATP-dependent helicase HepA
MSCFLRSKNHPEFGIGKFNSLQGEQVEIEYFDSPISMERETLLVDYNDTIEVRLASETRVYFLDRDSGFWRIGRVADHMDNVCHISTPNQHLETVPEQDVYTRWNYPIDDPSEHLAARLTETPYFHGPRSRLLASLVKQRAACSGLTALISSPVSLERHQVEVVRRVLEDPVQRYLLADEVGLGKTIEAGIILRQYILDHAEGHSALVIVPEALIEQWQEELKNRCQLGDGFGHNIHFISLEKLIREPALLEQIDVGFAIIDEAHQAVVGWNDSLDSSLRARFEALSEFCNPANTPRLLLLSATPVRRNEDGFLALLHLLDPAVYDVSRYEVFRDKVEQRQELANIFHTFTEDQDGYFLQEMVDDLTALFASDIRLMQLLDELRPWLDFSVPVTSPQRCAAIRVVRVHLSETYRLHRRLLRNRRSEELEGLLPGRAGLKTIKYEDDVFRVVEDRLESWRLGASSAVFGEEDSLWAQNLNKLFGVLLEFARCDLKALASLISIRLNISCSFSGDWGSLLDECELRLIKSVDLFPEEREFLNSVLEAICSHEDVYEERFDAIDDLIRAQFKGDYRVVVFVTSPNLADELYSYLEDLHNEPVYRHSSCESDWNDFRELKGKGVLICDYSAEEGLNLQGGRACILHADLPLSPNRIEQRMGRLDRFGIGNRVESLVLLPDGCSYQLAWHDCLNDAYEVFSRSIAALQYVVEDEMKKVSRALLFEGVQAFEDSKDRLRGISGVLNKELQDILAQDDLDAIDVTLADEQTDLTLRIETLEEDEGGLQRTFEGWLVNCLHVVCVDEDESMRKVIRYNYLSSDRRRPSLISANDFIAWFESSIERGAVSPDFRGPLTWAMSFARETSRCRNVGLARIGNPLVDSVHRYLRWDDRGTSFAFWRHSSLIPEGEVLAYFRFDFLVEFGVDSGAQESSDLKLNEMKRRGDAVFAPVTRSIWISEDMEVVDGAILAELTPEYHSGIRDKNLNSERWQIVEKQSFFSLDEWPELCRMACDRARKSLILEIDLKQRVVDSVHRQQKRNSVVHGQFKSRIDALHHSSFSDLEVRHAEQELKDEIMIHDYLLAGTKAPHLRLDAAGVIFLAGNKFPSLVE